MRSNSAICLLYMSANSSIREAEPLAVMWNKGFIIGVRAYTVVGEDVVGKLYKREDHWNTNKVANLGT